jgi:hypothetical protein
MDKAFGTMVVVLVIGGLIGAGGMYYYVQPQLAGQFAAGQAYQQALEPAVAIGADLEFTWDDDDFDHSATVDADGNVAADTDHTQLLTIDCDPDGEAATAIWIMLQHPLTGEDGLDPDIEHDDVRVTIEVGSISSIALYREGYLAGYELGDLPAGSAMEISVTVTFLEHDDEDFPDGKTLDCEIYIYQSVAGLVDSVDFTVST